MWTVATWHKMPGVVGNGMTASGWWLMVQGFMLQDKAFTEELLQLPFVAIVHSALH